MAALMAEEALTPNSRIIAKRKLSELPTSNHGQGGPKRTRLQDGNSVPLKPSSSNRAFDLPAENWHRIFSLVPPRTLGSLLRVNKLFHGFLDPPRGVGHVRPSPHHACASVLPPMKPNAIWQASRELFWPQMPSPLRGKTELDMWRLCCSKSCQFCGTLGLADEGEQPGEWRLGPGAEGVAPLFPFAFVSCAKCLPDVIIKARHLVMLSASQESDLLLSTSTPWFLMAGLSAAFLSSELHVIPHQVLSSGKDPLHAQVSKVFSSEQVKAITAEFEAVKALGLVLTNGWARGLEARGKIAFADHCRFEKWLVCGGVHQIRTCLEGTQSSSQRVAGAFSVNGVTQGRASLNVSPHAADVVTNSEPLANAGRTWKHASAAELRLPATDVTGRLQLEPSGATQASIVPSRHPKNKSWKEAAEDPKMAGEAKPETGGQSVLITPQASNESVTNDQVGYGALPAPEVNSEGLGNTGKSLQQILSGLVDEIVREWRQGGQEVTKATAPQFAVDVLLEVRKRFYSRQRRDAMAQSPGLETTTKKQERVRSTPRLSLGDMKWIFETKISKLICAPVKELFWCSECTSQVKPFQFQSVVQHYAAKHTAALSAGRTVVHWQAEWPEKLIFDLNPSERLHKQQGLAPAKAPGQTPAVRERAKDGAVTTTRLSSGNRWSNPTVPQHGSSGPHAQAPRGSNVELALPNVLPAGLLSPGEYNRRLVLMAKTWNEMSKDMAQVKGFPDAATAYILLDHLVTTFQYLFRGPAFFTMFLDCLSHQPDMHFARKIKCLRCRACELTRGSEKDRKLLTLPQLAAHFHAKHVANFDWRVDMISPPEGQASTELRSSLAQHPTVLQLTSRALPRFVPADDAAAAQRANGNNDAALQRPWLAPAHLVYGSRASLRVSDPAAPGAMMVYDDPAESYYRIKHEPSQGVPGDALVRDRSVAGRGVDDDRLASLDGYRAASRSGGTYRLDDVRDGLGDQLVQRPMQHDGARPSAGFVEPHGQASRARSSAAFGRDYEDYDPRYPAPDNRRATLPN
ncbi:hypothetical protein L249_7329 [Ophiocordyceps polyrhachis-furcata BCC 54312]|uniref:DUF7892 domain-containing protein n=1 Tax=Ophiocordyceps polyrhachis-furcata BCC 54312 TaxID=1330021 RepID=A0A367LA69_9HYPO|nr:hypothetical protein L249_7329 [Ophiocordyceps polyrhachis-furcata BCC 54312]